MDENHIGLNINAIPVQTLSKMARTLVVKVPLQLKGPWFNSLGRQSARPQAG